MELQLGGYGVGYRGMCRFRSGPIFMQPVMQAFDYAWTLDTDGYFPADLGPTDPLERMWREDRTYGYSHVSRDQASAVGESQVCMEGGLLAVLKNGFI
eukprot:symbB.v1.2.003723.t1/scaffold176.1/size287750/5